MEKISVCSQCKQEAQMTKAGKQGYRTYCKPCWNVKRKAWAVKRPPKRIGPAPVKACTTCFEIREMAKGGREGYRAVCKPCWNLEQKEWRDQNKDRWRALRKRYLAKNRLRPEWVEASRKRGREYWSELRNAALDVYGRSCACCGEKEEAFLTLDHVNNDGAAHRRSLKTKGSHVFKWLRDNQYPEGFQILCSNCNLGRFKNGGICPHKACKPILSVVNS